LPNGLVEQSETGTFPQGTGSAVTAPAPPQIDTPCQKQYNGSMQLEKLKSLAGNDTERELLSRINPRKLPAHIAIIMDGNGRWAKREGKRRSAGHTEGARRAAEIAEASSLLGISYLTLFAFSTENWKRPKSEVQFLFKLMENNILKKRDRFLALKIRLSILGDISPLDPKLQELIRETAELSGKDYRTRLNIALNYGSRAEIVRAVKKFIASGRPAEELDEKSFREFLFTQDIPDPDLLVRTSNEHRISNFLLYQLAYSELYFSPLFWPEFGRAGLYAAIIEYQQRQRRFGGI
jgi:undecaprenyl diphosphate synthase